MVIKYVVLAVPQEITFDNLNSHLTTNTNSPTVYKKFENTEKHKKNDTEKLLVLECEVDDDNNKILVKGYNLGEDEWNVCEDETEEKKLTLLPLLTKIAELASDGEGVEEPETTPRGLPEITIPEEMASVYLNSLENLETDEEKTNNEEPETTTDNKKQEKAIDLPKGKEKLRENEDINEKEKRKEELRKLGPWAIFEMLDDAWNHVSSLTPKSVSDEIYNLANDVYGLFQDKKNINEENYFLANECCLIASRILILHGNINKNTNITSFFKSTYMIACREYLKSQDFLFNTRGHYYLLKGGFENRHSNDKFSAIAEVSERYFKSRKKVTFVDFYNYRENQIKFANPKFLEEIRKALDAYSGSKDFSFWSSRYKTVEVLIDQLKSIDCEKYSSHVYKKLVLSVLERRYQFLPENSELSIILENILKAKLNITDPQLTGGKLAKTIAKFLYSDFSYDLYDKEGNPVRTAQGKYQAFHYKLASEEDLADQEKLHRKNTIADLYGYIDSRETSVRYKFMVWALGEESPAVVKIRDRIAYAYKLIDAIEDGCTQDDAPKPFKENLLVGSDLEKIVRDFKRGLCSVRLD